MRTVYLPLEIFTRELKGKILLAIKLAVQNYQVEIGYNQIIRKRALEAEDSGIYFEIKGKSPKGMAYLDHLSEKGFKIVGQDEESGITYFHFDDFLKNRPEARNINDYDAFFTWGKSDFDHYKRIETKTDTVVNTGSPRTILWQPKARSLYETEINQIHQKYSKYTLFVSNLAGIVNLMPPRQMQKMTDNHGYDHEFWKYYSRRLDWEKHALETTLRIIKNLSRENTQNIVFRPHPSENAEYWRSRFKKLNNVYVNKKGDTSSWIHAAEKVIHAGSTTAIESYLSGVPTYSFQQEVNFEDCIMTPNLIGGQLRIINDEIKLLNGNDNTVFAKDTLDTKISNLNSTLSLEVISRKIIEISEGKKKFNKEYSIMERKTYSDYSTRIMDILKYGRSKNELLHREKRPPISEFMFINMVNDLCNFIGVENRFIIKQTAESSFVIKLQN